MNGMNGKPAFIIGATKSGGGKTTLTVGILAALVRRGMKVQCFKCGPDFIDPTLHYAVTSTVSYNLDLRMMGTSCCKNTFNRKSCGSDASVIEGVMGLFDGGDASTATLAKTLNVPVILIVDAASSAESAAAILKGFSDFDPDVRICGVIFNRIGSPRHRELIENAVRDHCRINYVGFMPRNDAFVIPERHLGLHMGSEKPLTDSALDSLADSVEENLDIDLILKMAGKKDEYTGDHEVCKKYDTLQQKENRGNSHRRPKVRIGIARDEAFCFYYQQNFELMEERGFELVPFSPIHDTELPDLLDMLYLGGGYPENYGTQLSDNVRMREQILAFHRDDRPIYGECGGFMYLCRTLTDMDGNCTDMVGIFPFNTVMNKRLRRLGYRRVHLHETCLLGSRGDILHGHEFHYSDIDRDQHSVSSDGLKTLYQLDNNSHEGYSVGSAVGSYIHLHFGNTPSVLNTLHNQLYNQQTGNSIDTNDNA